jgi:hypothetical protein
MKTTADTSFGAWLSQRRKALDQIMDTDYPAFEEFARLGKGARRLIVFGAGDGVTSWRWSPHQLTNLPAPPTALIGRD